MDLRRAADFQFAQLFVVVRMGVLPSSFHAGLDTRSHYVTFHVVLSSTFRSFIFLGITLVYGAYGVIHFFLLSVGTSFGFTIWQLLGNLHLICSPCTNLIPGAYSRTSL